jgi:hypothetical protein
MPSAADESNDHMLTEALRDKRLYYRTTRTAFPDQRHENGRFHITDDGVIVGRGELLAQVYGNQ